MNENNSQGKNMGFIDDYANQSSGSRDTVRNRNGKPVFANPLENEKKAARKVTKNSRKRYRKEKSGFVAIAVFLAAVAVFSLYIILKDPERGEKNPPQETTADTALNVMLTPEESTDTEEVPVENNSFVTVDNTEIHKGCQILVNYKYEYIFPEEFPLVNIYNKEARYSVSTTETYLQKEALTAFEALLEDFYENSGCDDVLVVSAYRSMEKQQEIYQDRLDRFGSQYAAAYVADPGYSEHHTGYAMDLQIYTGGEVYGIDTYDGAKWFNDNYANYGYILRYPEHKAAITSINYEGWHYRYVGIPHSLIMKKLDLCHEEYIDYLREYTFENPLVYNKNTGEIKKGLSDGDFENGNVYIIYYVPSEEGDITKVPLLENREYSISGNNVDGFVLTYNPQ